MLEKIFGRDRNHRVNKLEKECKKILDSIKDNTTVSKLDLIYCDISDANHGVMRGISKDGKMYGFMIVGGSMTMVLMKDFSESGGK